MAWIERVGLLNISLEPFHSTTEERTSGVVENHCDSQLVDPVLLLQCHRRHRAAAT